MSVHIYHLTMMCWWATHSHTYHLCMTNQQFKWHSIHFDLSISFSGHFRLGFDFLFSIHAVAFIMNNKTSPVIRSNYQFYQRQKKKKERERKKKEKVFYRRPKMICMSSCQVYSYLSSSFHHNFFYAKFFFFSSFSLSFN